MRIVALILIFLISFLNPILREYIVITMSLMWFIYTINLCIKISKLRDGVITSDKISNNIPTDKPASHLRYFLKRKIDNKIFITIIFELLQKKYISLIRQRGEYFFVDNKVEGEILSKSEESVKKILFTEVGNKENVAFSNINKTFRKNSAYIYNEYKIFKDAFEYECVGEKYFKSSRNIVDKLLFYFVVSFILALYNLIFTNAPIISLPILLITIALVKIINDFKNIEEDRKDEYREWLEFKNYLSCRYSNLHLLDNNTLEKYSLYAYVLDSFKPFEEELYKKYANDKNCMEDSVLLTIINTKIFDYMEKELNKSINACKIKGLFYKNKGRRY